MEVVYLRTDRSGGEPVARKANVSWCFILCCAGQENAGFCRRPGGAPYPDSDWGGATYNLTHVGGWCG
jgi:hypothetical protein